MNYGGTGVSLNFVGLKNYIRLFSDSKFPMIFKQTIIFVMLRVAGSFIIGLTVAMIIANAEGWVAMIFKVLFLIPWALSNVVNGLMWHWMYNSEYGILNEGLLRMGFIDQYVPWLSNINTALYAIIFAAIWKTVPFVSLMFLAAIQNIPQSVYDAAEVDGANTYQKFFYVTLPSIKLVMTMVFVIQTIWALKAFDLIWVLTKGGPADRTTIMSVYAYKQSFIYLRMDYGSAIAYFITFIIIIFTWFYIKTLGKDVD